MSRTKTLESRHKKQTSKDDGKVVLHINKLSVHLPENNRYLLHNISFDVRQGEFVVLLGSNGSGKSSLISAINHTSQLRLKGNISIDGQKVNKINQDLFVATITQNVNSNLFPSLSILENFLVYQSTLGKVWAKINRVNRADGNATHGSNVHFCDNRRGGDGHHNRHLSSDGCLGGDGGAGNPLSPTRLDIQFREHLAQFNRKLSQATHQPVGNLSGGEKQTLALALTMFFPRKILLLDEHTSALDPRASKSIMEITNQKIRDFGLTCIMTTHNLDYAMAYGDVIIALKNGEIFKKININAKNDIKKDDLLEIFSP